jgi:CubicO group peptidase (beta-lactamase class C family)
MKKHAMFSVHSIRWMVLGVCMIAAALLPGAGLAKAAYPALSSQSDPDLNLLSKTDKAWAKDYLRKKRQYTRFLDGYIKNKRKELGAEGVSISVISKDDLLFLRGYGYADKAAQSPVTPDTLFGIGSVSKLFTGIAVMQLVEQGEIDLDAPLETYIPDFGYKTHFPDAGPITVRTLMTHQSGLVEDIEKGWSSVNQPEHDFNELVEFLKAEYVAYPTDYITSYSNCAVALLGIVIENVSGMAFRDYIEDNICKPLGMLRSNISLRDDMLPTLAKSYDSEGAEFPFKYIRDEPAGAFISNAKEMSLFMRMILNGGELSGEQILKPEILQQMFVQQNSNLEPDFPNDHGDKWGLSWVLYNPALAYAGKYVGHSGGIPNNFYTQLHILPEHGLAVVVETNSERGAGISGEVADMAMIKALEIFKGIKRPEAAPSPPLMPLTQDHIKQTTGTYATNYFGLLSIYPDNKSLLATSPAFGDLELELKPHQDGWFSFYLNDQPVPELENIRITVKNGVQERFVGIQVYDESGTILSMPFGCEYQIPEEIPPKWKNRVGAYRIINPDWNIPNDYTVSIQALPPGVLTVDGIVLDPIFDDQAVRMGLGRGFNETVQVVDCDGDECLYYRGYLLKKQSGQKRSLDNRPITGPSDLKRIGLELEKKLARGFSFD